MEIYYFGEFLKKENIGGVKARTDIETIMSKRYSLYESIDMHRPKSFLGKSAFVLKPHSLETLYKLSSKKNGFFIAQYPFPYNKLFNKMLTDFLTNQKSVLIVHDIPSIQFGNKINIQKEIDFMNNCDLLIVHNQRMEDLLQSYGVQTKCIKLQLFDYLINKAPTQKDYLLGHDIVFAGNLGKSNFLEKVPGSNLQLNFNLYGIGLNTRLKKEQYIHWLGSYGTNEIPYKLKGSFGLIWDGESLDTCTGHFGEYQKYNNPHKLSLYIVAGLPVIVWSKAAVADLVTKFKIGFTVDSLFECKKIIDKLTDADYALYKENIKKLQSKVIKGYFTNQVFDKMEQELANQK